MADPTRPPVVDGDAAFNRLQEKLNADFHTGFDAWLDRVHPQTPDPGRPLDANDGIPPNAAGGAVPVALDLVFDLTRLCRNFVFDSVWAWAFLQRRHGASADAVMKLVGGRAAEAEWAVYRWQWRLGVGQIAGLVSEGWGNEWTPLAWVEEVWRVVVEETDAEFIVDILQPALTRWTPTRAQRLAKWTPETPEYERVQQFIEAVRFVTGWRPNRTDIYLAAGYKDRRGFQKFQSGRGTATAKKKFDEILSMSPAAFHQLREQQRPAEAAREAAKKKAARKAAARRRANR